MSRIVSQNRSALAFTLAAGVIVCIWLPSLAARVLAQGPAIPTGLALTLGTDITPPAISAVAAGLITASGATITWTTNEASDSRIEYGPTTAYGSLTPLNASFVTSHVISLSGVASYTQYHFRVRSSDAAGNVATSANFTFTTLDGAAPSVSITAPAPLASVAGTVTVTASAADNVGVLGVQFKLDGVNLGAEDLASPYSRSWDTGNSSNGAHTLTAVARDAAGNQTTSSPVTVTVFNDTTAPTVSLTSPAAGATVSGTITVAASASDNVGVAGVQFRLDGANLGAEDTSAPHSVSWNTTAANNGSHTLAAVARDAGGNQTVSLGVTVTVSNSTPSPGGIAALYPGDVGIETHPDVVFTEMFEQSSISTMTSQYTNVAQGAGLSFSTSKPAGSSGSQSLQMATTAANPAATLYKALPNDQQWYLRYYVNYNSAAQYSHASAWMGGYNPPLSYPNPQAGSKPAGNDRFSTGVEPLSFDNDRWMPYTYWKGMRQSGDGNYWGNVFLPADPTIRMARNRWYCVETQIKLNTPTTDTNGELAVWIDGQKILHLGKGFPNGSWSGGTFTENPSGSPFDGFQWRSDAALNLNWIWLQNYVTSGPSTIQFDHVVLARNYVGCLASPGSDTTPPAVSISAPAGGATVSGSAVTVSAAASDNIGVAGVQFKRDGVNVGAEDVTSPYSIAWNTTTVTNGSHTLTAVARDAAGNTNTSAGASVTVSNVIPPPSGTWPNEPSGFVPVNDQPWNLLTGNGWNYLRRAASKAADIVTDAAAPFSPLNVLRMIFTPDMGSNGEPGVHWIGLSGQKEIYTAWWLKVSPNWTCSPAGCGKMTFLFATGGGNVYTTILNPESGEGPPFRVGLRPQWGGYDLNFYPNVTTTLIYPGEWRRIEFYYKYETSPGAGDGIIRWWVDGVLNGNYTNVFYPSAGFVEFQYAPTLQNAPPAEQYMYLDHTHVSTR